MGGEPQNRSNMIKCVLDEDGCIDLLAVMRIMNQVDQEQVWAIAYELAALMQRLWPASDCALIESLAQICIHRDGHIHEKTLKTLPPSIESKLQDANLPRQTQVTSTSEAKTKQGLTMKTGASVAPTTITTTTVNSSGDEHTRQQDSSVTTGQTRMNPEAANGVDQKSQSKAQQPQRLPPSPPITPELPGEALERRPASSQSELVSSLGIALFWALDYGIPDDEERNLSMTMEYLITKAQGELTLDEILEICIKRLPIATKTNADLHYRAVCKSLVGDTIELSIFLDKIYKATMELSGMISGSTGIDGGGGGGRRGDGPNAASESVGNCCLAALAKQSDKSLATGQTKGCCDSILSQHHHLNYHQLALVNHADLRDLGLPLASLRALKIDEWARLWMQVIKEMRQRSKFKHLGITTSGQELSC